MHRRALLCALLLSACQHSPNAPITASELRGAEAVAGLAYTESERALLLPDATERLDDYAALHEVPYDNADASALRFDPAATYGRPAAGGAAPRWSAVQPPARPEDLNALAFLTIRELGAMLRAGRISAVELTELALARLRRFDPQLHAVVTLMPEAALAQAREADAAFARGEDRGPLQGIPYGLKDLFAAPGYPTTWGTPPFQQQRLDQTAAVAEKLAAAGAVLVAKLSLGELAWGDVWFGGQTRNPWNLEQGSSGSSAGSAAAVSAGLLPFAIGTETWGSIVSPAQRTGITGLRPTFGRVSRFGAMALSPSMDKVGVLCRDAEDCGIVFDAIRGADPREPETLDASFAYAPRADLGDLVIGYLAKDFDGNDPGAVLDRETLAQFQRLSARPLPLALPDLPIGAMGFVLAAEAAAQFDALTRSGADDAMVRQVRDAWPNTLRAAQLIPAVEFLQANRLRLKLMHDMQAMTENVDLWLAPATEGDNLLATNLSGHPCIALPNGFTAPDAPHAITLCAKPYQEALLLAAAQVYQNATAFENQVPPRFDPSAPAPQQPAPAAQ